MSEPKPSPKPNRRFDMLGFLFIALKLCGQIHWSWWWITSPFWITAIMELLVSFNDQINKTK